VEKSFIVIMVMCATKKEAKRITDKLLKKCLVACVNIIPGVESKFWWKGAIDSAKETLIMMKTLHSNFKKVETEIKRLHSYEVSEIIAIPIIAGSKDYLSWIKGVVRTA
jgi:periplasmic divalent cation tolerance protein